MNRAIPWVIAGGVVVAAATAFVIAAPERDTGPVFIEGSRPVTEEQVRQKLGLMDGRAFRSCAGGESFWQWAQRKDVPNSSQSMC